VLCADVDLARSLAVRPSVAKIEREEVELATVEGPCTLRLRADVDAVKDGVAALREMGDLAAEEAVGLDSEPRFLPRKSPNRCTIPRPAD